MEELEDELQIASDAKLRLEVFITVSCEIACYELYRLIYKLQRLIMKENCKAKRNKLKNQDDH